METDGRYMMRNNYRYSVALLDWCQDNDVPFLYASSASVYGGGSDVPRGARVRGAAQRLRLFEVPVRPVRAAACCPSAPRRSPASAISTSTGRASSTRGGWRRSRWHFFNQYRADGRVRLFEGSGGYADGEQRRDFVSVDDVVKVNLDFLDHPQRSGIFNLGTGRAATFNEVAAATINACRAAAGEPALALPELVAAGAITYIPFPPALAGKYQSFTEADLTRLRAAGYRAPMLSVEEGVGATSPRCWRPPAEAGSGAPGKPARGRPGAAPIQCA